MQSRTKRSPVGFRRSCAADQRTLLRRRDVDSKQGVAWLLQHEQARSGLHRSIGQEGSQERGTVGTDADAREAASDDVINANHPTPSKLPHRVCGTSECLLVFFAVCECRAHIYPPCLPAAVLLALTRPHPLHPSYRPAPYPDAALRSAGQQVPLSLP